MNQSGTERPTEDGPAYRAVVLDESRPADVPVLARLRADAGVEIRDTRDRLTAELAGLLPRPAGPGGVRWAYYPWRRTLVSVLDEAQQRRLRLDRNRNKITSAEQERLAGLTVGVVGLSVGHAIAHVLAMEGLVGRLRLADFDRLDLSNLNRIPASLLDVGENKAIVAARRIAEVDPYLTVEVFTDGVDESNVDDFLDGLDLVVDECDSLDVKTLLRLESRRRRLPVVMETNDRGLLDIERFDLEPDRPIFHGLFAGVDVDALRALTPSEKAPYAMRIVEPTHLSARMAASMVEIGRTLTAWPQLAGEVHLGAATVAAAVRRIGLGEAVPSGRVRIDLDATLQDLAPPAPSAPASAAPTDPDADPAPALPRDGSEDLLGAVLGAIRLAPSGGNSQPWQLSVPGPDRVVVSVARDRTSLMDVGFRGSWVAIGAATFNARVAAARSGVRAEVEPPDGDAAVAVGWGAGGSIEDGLGGLYRAVLERTTNRNPGRREPVAPILRHRLVQAARAEGADLLVLDGDEPLRQLADVLAASDRIRYLTPELHAQMMAEVRWPDRDRVDSGIDVRTLSTDEVEQIKLRVAARPEVMAALAAWDAGAALGDPTRDRVLASSAVAVVTVTGTEPADYLRGGAAVERVWVVAEQAGLAVQPVSPVFLFARSRSDLQVLSARYWSELEALQHRFLRITGMPADGAPALVLQLSHRARPAFRSRRLPWTDLLTSATVEESART